MKNKRKLKFIALSLVTMFALSSCTTQSNNSGGTQEPAKTEDSSSGNSGGNETTKPEASSGKVEVIRVWSDNAHEKELRLSQIEKFNQTTGKEKGIEIEYTVHGSNWEDVIRMAAQSDDAPDLFRPNGTILKDFVDAGYLVPISDLPGSEEFLSRYDGQLSVNQHVFDGETYTLPYNLTTYKFVINRDLFDKNDIADAPKTWDDVREYAKIITENGDGVEYGYSLGLQSNWIATSYVLRHAGQNVGHIGFDNDALQFNFSAMLPEIEAIKGMVADGSVLPGSSGLDADAMRAQFSEGRVGMLPAVSFDVGVYNEQFPAKCNWEVVDIPTFGGDRPYKEFSDATSLLGVGKAALDNDEKAAKVLEVLKFFYSDECMAEMYENSLYIPFRQEAINMATKEPAQKGFAQFADVPDKVLMLPIPDTFVTVEGQNYRDTVLGLFVEGSTADATEVMRDLDQRYNDALAAQVDSAIVDSFKTPAGRDIKPAN